MTHIPSILAALAALAALATTVHAQPAGSLASTVKFSKSKVTQTLDCRGADLTITGDDDKLTISSCATVNVVGNHNLISVRLMPTSSIAALGDDNHIVFQHAPGFEVRVSSSGRNNEIIPDMARDSHDISPVTYPLAAH